MTSKPVAQLLVDLGVARTHTRPHVSNDNPYSEAQFKTLKYCPAFPDRFGSIHDARAFCAAFFDPYNHVHRHAGSGCTPPRRSTTAPPARSAPTAPSPSTRPTPPTRPVRPPADTAQAAHRRLDQRTHPGGAHTNEMTAGCPGPSGAASSPSRPGHAGLLVAGHGLDDVHRRALGDQPGRVAVTKVMDLRPLHQARAGKRGQPHPLAEVRPAQRPPRSLRNTSSSSSAGNAARCSAKVSIRKSGSGTVRRLAFDFGYSLKVTWPATSTATSTTCSSRRSRSTLRRRKPTHSAQRRPAPAAVATTAR